MRLGYILNSSSNCQITSFHVVNNSFLKVMVLRLCRRCSRPLFIQGDAALDSHEIQSFKTTRKCMLIAALFCHYVTLHLPSKYSTLSEQKTGEYFVVLIFNHDVFFVNVYLFNINETTETKFLGVCTRF